MVITITSIRERVVELDVGQNNAKRYAYTVLLFKGDATVPPNAKQ